MPKEREQEDQEIDRILAQLIHVAETPQEMHDLIDVCMDFEKDYIVPFLLAYITIQKEKFNNQ